MNTKSGKCKFKHNLCLCM